MESKVNCQKEIEQIQKTPLCLVSFSNGYLKKSWDTVLFELYKEETTNRKRKRILVASNRSLLYYGSNHGSGMYNVTSTVLKLAVKSKKTGVLKIYNAEYFILKPKLKCDILMSSVERNYMEQSLSLALEFGSKTKKKSLSSKLKFQSEGNKTIDDSLLKNISQNVISDDVSEQSCNAIIPPQNNSATCVNEIYNILDIISAEEYNALDVEACSLKEVTRDILDAWKNEAKYCDIIIHYLEINYQNISQEKAKLLCYLQFMVTLLNAKYSDLRKKDPFPSIPQPFKKKLIDRYLINKSLPQRLKDKLLACSLVINLHINNFCIDSKHFAKSTKTNIKRLTSIAYALGCYVRSNRGEDSKIIELKLPLFKYEPFRSRK